MPKKGMMHDSADEIIQDIQARAVVKELTRLRDTILHWGRNSKAPQYAMFGKHVDAQIEGYERNMLERSNHENPS